MLQFSTQKSYVLMSDNKKVTDLNLAIMDILDMADYTLKYAQQSIFQNGQLFCKGGQMCEIIQIEE